MGVEDMGYTDFDAIRLGGVGTAPKTFFGTSAPSTTASTYANIAVGDFYINTTTPTFHVCTANSAGTLTWKTITIS